MAEVATTLTPILFSKIAPLSTIKFSYQTEALVFDVPSITAASISVTKINAAGDLRITAGGKTFTLSNSLGDGLLQQKITPMNFVFADGSKYIFGSQTELISGSAGADQIHGTESIDDIKGLDGNDRLFGYGGSDRIYGGAGNDYLDGGLGENYLSGGAGNDTYVYRGQRDTIVEEASAAGGVDTVIAQSSGIHLYGSARYAGIENVTLAEPVTNMYTPVEAYGNALNNVLRGNSLNNRLEGLTGNDTLLGGAGNDILDGGEGNDILDGGDGFDQMIGGAGSDTFTYTKGDTIIESAAVAGVDTVIVKADYIDLMSSTGLSGVENVTLAAPIAGTTSSAPITPIGAHGNALNNRLVGNALNNVLEGRDGNDTLLGEAGDDRLMGGNGNDILSGGSGFDKLEGGSGNDTLDGGDGVDLMIGGDGNDTYHYTQGDSIDERNLLVAGGVDTVISKATYIDLMSNVGLSGVENVTLATPIYYVASTTPAVTPKEAFGNALNNVMVGNTLSNILDGREGNDTLRGEAGDDRLKGGDGNDTLHGGVGNDALEGGAGNDILDGGEGFDHMAGGAGSDTYHYTNGDTIVEYAGDAGVDTVIVKADYIDLMSSTGLSAIENATLAAPIYSSSSTIPPITPKNLLGNGLNNVLTGNALDNFIQGREGHDKILGGAGNDRLYGDAGNDSLYGDAGNDRLEGGLGDDYLDGGEGADIMIGGDGHDTYVYTSGDQILESATTAGGVDTVISKVEVIDLNYFGAIENATLAAPVATTSDDIDPPLVAIGNNLGNILKGNVLSNHLDGRNGDDKLYGFGGDDTLLGGEGTDLLEGGEGNDKLEGGSGNDVLNGGAGADILNGGIGADMFVFTTLKDIVNPDQSVDTIFADSLDKIDLSRLDANLTTTSDEAFQYIGSNAFSAVGQIRIADGYLFGNNDADAEADFAIKLVGLDATTFTSANLIA